MSTTQLWMKQSTEYQLRLSTNEIISGFRIYSVRYLNDGEDLSTITDQPDDVILGTFNPELVDSNYNDLTTTYRVNELFVNFMGTPEFYIGDEQGHPI